MTAWKSTVSFLYFAVMWILLLSTNNGVSAVESEGVNAEVGLNLFGMRQTLSAEDLRVFSLVGKMTLRDDLKKKATVTAIQVTDQTLELHTGMLTLFLVVTGGRTNSSVSTQWFTRTIEIALVESYPDLVQRLRAHAHFPDFSNLVVPSDVEEILVNPSVADDPVPDEATKDRDLVFVIGAAAASCAIVVALMTILFCYVWSRREKEANHSLPIQLIGVPPTGWVRGSTPQASSPSDESLVNSESFNALDLAPLSPLKLRMTAKSPYPTQQRRVPELLSPQPKQQHPTVRLTSPGSEGEDIRNWTFSSTSSSEANGSSCSDSIQVSLSMESIDDFEASICSTPRMASKKQCLFEI